MNQHSPHPNQIALLLGEPDLSDFVENPEFFLENFWAESKELHQPCCPKPFSGTPNHGLQTYGKFSFFNELLRKKGF